MLRQCVQFGRDGELCLYHSLGLFSGHHTHLVPRRVNAVYDVTDKLVPSRNKRVDDKPPPSTPTHTPSHRRRAGGPCYRDELVKWTESSESARPTSARPIVSSAHSQWAHSQLGPYRYGRRQPLRQYVMSKMHTHKGGAMVTLPKMYFCNTP